MSEIDSTELALIFVGATILVVVLNGLIEITVSYTLPDWLTTVLIFGFAIGYYQFKE